MDDTVLLTTTKDMIVKIFSILMNFCDKYGLQINELKTKLMVTNGKRDDR